MNITFTGTIFTGETLAATPLTLEATDGRLVSQTEGQSVCVAISEVRTSDRLAGVPRFLYLPGGRTIETPDNQAIDLLLAGQRRGRTVAAVHWLEARARVAAVAAVLLVATVAATLWWGMPILARNAAMAVPDPIEKKAGQTALATISRLLAPTRLSRINQRRVDTQLDRLLKAQPLTTRPELVFRFMGGQYPNAFALPGGYIVISDELVTLADDDELAAVLAHEIGHWQLRHGLQGVLRSSAALLVVSTVTGDLSTLTTFASTIPFALLQRGYSREFEEQADTYALGLLRKAGIDAVHFASILRKLQDTRPKQGQDFSYLSTHPSTEDRIRRIDPHGETARAVASFAPSSARGDEAKPEPSVMLRGVHPLASPFPLYQPAPLYPYELTTAHREGMVKIEFVIDENGKVCNPHAAGSTSKELEAPAIAAVAQWRFIPRQEGGRNVATSIFQTIDFRLHSPIGQAVEPRVIVQPFEILGQDLSARSK